MQGIIEHGTAQVLIHDDVRHSEPIESGNPLDFGLHRLIDRTQGGPEHSTAVLAFDIFMNAFSVSGQMGYASAAAWLLFLVIGIFVILQMRLMRSKRIYDE